MRTLAAAASLLFCAATSIAQFRVQPVGEHPGDVSLRLILRQLESVGTFMQTTAHPDDEDNGLLALMAHGRGMRSVLVSATRGDGGQNEIGPELFEALAVLRTEELAAAHRFDGAEQFFTRASDFGYSFSVDETLRAWGHQEILGDFVRHIRAVRPDVIAGFLCGGGGGGQHHQASTQLTREAFAAAADPARFSGQIAGGLRPWQARRLYCTDMSSFVAVPRDAPHRLVTIPDVFEPLLGRAYNDLGIEARSMHKSQGTSQLLPLPGQSAARTYRLERTLTGSPDSVAGDLFDGIDTSIGSLAAYAGARPPAALTAALQEIAHAVEAATRSADRNGQAAAAPPLAKGLGALRRLRAGLAGMPLDEAARFEIDFRLDRKERQFQQALLLAHGLRLEVLADDGLVTVGQTIRVDVLGASYAGAGLQVHGVSFSGLEGPVAPCTASLSAGGTFGCTAELTVGSVPFTGPYWRPKRDAARYDVDPDVPFGAPFRPSPFRASIALTVAEMPVTAERTIEFRYDNVIAGEKRMELHVVPSLAIAAGPQIVVIPASAVPADSPGSAPAARSIEVTVANHRREPVDAAVVLRAPPQWSVRPDRIPVAFTREDESATVTFTVAPPPDAVAGEYAVTALVEHETLGSSSTGYEVIEYPHVRRRHLLKDARTRLKIVDVTIPADLKVGYVAGVGDQVPQAIEQLGATLRFIGPGELAGGDLSAYDVIVTGVRAYERRPDLRANNHRLLEYVARGGTAIVQYNKFEFNQAQYGPFPAQVSSNRITDESAPVELLVPDHPVFTWPNRLGPETWRGWVQERGLYFLGDRDPRYVDLVRLTDPFDYNPGPRTGALVEASVGEGRWIYVGLGLWRQLPAGTDGAYRLLANLLSLGRRP